MTDINIIIIEGNRWPNWKLWTSDIVKTEGKTDTNIINETSEKKALLMTNDNEK